ncbi:MAG TPA: cold shock domain-containing protein [Ilumatobacteraceae bacterium]|nr:cold shock domain-containing protein [Ilumatobacteraceae bacterium]
MSSEPTPPTGDESTGVELTGVELTGVVVAFDVDRGLGEVTVDATGERLPFHCVSIADGTRMIEVGTEVVFATMVKYAGREAIAIRPAP